MLASIGRQLPSRTCVRLTITLDICFITDWAGRLSRNARFHFGLSLQRMGKEKRSGTWHLPLRRERGWIATWSLLMPGIVVLKLISRPLHWLIKQT